MFSRADHTRHTQTRPKQTTHTNQTSNEKRPEPERMFVGIHETNLVQTMRF